MPVRLRQCERAGRRSANAITISKRPARASACAQGRGTGSSGAANAPQPGTQGQPSTAQGFLFLLALQQIE